MKIGTLFLTLLLAVSASSVSAQKAVDGSVKVEEEVAAVADPIMSITPEQMEAIRQLDLELEAIEARKKAGVNYQSDRASLIAQREEKIRKILNPEQLERYNAMQQMVEAANEKERERRLNKAATLKAQPVAID